MSRSRLIVLVVVTFSLLTIWLGLTAYAFFCPCIYQRNVLVLSRWIAILGWAAFFLWQFTIHVDGTTTWQKIYRGEATGLKVAGVQGVAVALIVVFGFAGIIGFSGIEILAMPIKLFGLERKTVEVSIHDISYFRGSYTHTYIIDLGDDQYGGAFLWSDRDPALSGVNAVARAWSNDVRCLELSVRGWSFGAFVEAIQPCRRVSDMSSQPTRKTSMAG